MTCTLVDPTSAPRAAPATAPGVLALPSLSGRKIALLKNAWPSWHRMLDRFECLLAGQVEGVSAGQYLIPNGSAADPDLLMSVAGSADAAVIGLANCGSCTAWSYHDAVSLTALGLPVVLVATSEFTSLVDGLAAARGVRIPTVVIPANPETVDDESALRLLDHAYQPIVDALLTPSTARAPAAASRPPVLGPDCHFDDEDAALQECHDRGWTDGLPVVLPTVRRVDAILAALGGPDAVVAAMPPRSGPGRRSRWSASRPPRIRTRRMSSSSTRAGSTR